MFSQSKKTTVKKSAIVEETPLFAQLLPFANRMNDKVQLVNALALLLLWDSQFLELLYGNYQG